MSPNHPNFPRFVILVLATVIVATLLVGIFQAFAPARAAAVKGNATAVLAASTPTVIPIHATDTPPVMKVGDTTGIIALAIILVAIIIFGTIWGRRTALLRLGRK